MGKGFFGFTLSMLLVASFVFAATKIPRIAYLTVSSLDANKARVEAFRHGLRELGYIEGKNILIDWRSGDGKHKSEDEIVAAALRLNMDLIVTSGPTMTRAAKQATAKIPIVMAFDSDPVRNGFVASLARPGGNITGLSALSPELSGKQLELLKEVIPKLSQIAVLGNSDEPANQNTLKEIELVAHAMSVRVQALDVRAAKDIEIALASATTTGADALIVLPSLILADRRAQFMRGPGDERLLHGGRGEPHVAPDGDRLRLEPLGVRAADRARALLVELGGVDPADVVRLEDLRV